MARTRARMPAGLRRAGAARSRGDHPAARRAWWQDGVLYQVYPRSFADSDADWGYDVSGYCDVHPDFGTLADIDALIADAHAAGIRVLLDLVPNHTSDRHPWFHESRSSRDNPKGDWYVWADPRPDGSPPNNWVSMFGGPAWEWEPRRGQFYLRNFTREQPDTGRPRERAPARPAARVLDEPARGPRRPAALARDLRRLRAKPILLGETNTHDLGALAGY